MSDSLPHRALPWPGARPLGDAFFDRDACLLARELLGKVIRHRVDGLGLRVPDDIRVVGCDNSYYCPYLSPPLSSVAFPQEELGQRMMEELLGMIAGTSEPAGEILLSPRLVERQSSR